MTLLEEKLFKPLKELALQGLEARQLSLALTFGLVLGIFPVLGSTTLLCLILGFFLRLNPVAIQIGNYLAYPAQLALLFPLYAGGIWLFGGAMPDMGLEQIVAMASQTPFKAIHLLWEVSWKAVGLWALLALPLALLLFFPLQSLAERVCSSTAKENNKRHG